MVCSFFNDTPPSCEMRTNLGRSFKQENGLREALMKRWILSEDSAKLALWKWVKERSVPSQMG